MMLCICMKFHENISKGFRVIEGPVFPHSGFLKGHNSVKNVGKVMVLVPAYRLMMLYITLYIHVCFL